MFWAERESVEPIRAIPLGKARMRQTGSDVTLISWGNTVEKAIEAIQQIRDEASIELIDLRSISPWDHEMIEESVRKTGRVIVVQEDTENCSVGQMIITHLMSRTDVWSDIITAPILVSKGNVMIGYNPIYEYAALPDVARIVGAIHRSAAPNSERATVAAAGNRSVLTPQRSEPRPITRATTQRVSSQHAQSITVPI